MTICKQQTINIDQAMNEEMKLIIGMIGLLVASGLITWSAQPSEFAPVPSKRKRIRKTKVRLKEMAPYRNSHDGVVLNPFCDATTGSAH